MMKHFTIAKRQIDHVAILEINGELDAHTAFQLEQQFKTLIETESLPHHSELFELRIYSKCWAGCVHGLYRRHSKSWRRY